APVVNTLPVCGLLLALVYTGRGAWITWRRVALLLIPSAITTVLALTSQHHDLWRTGHTVLPNAPVPVIVTERQIGTWFNTLWGYTLIGTMVVLIVRAMREAPAIYVRRALVMLGGLAISLIPHVRFEAGVTPIPGYNIAPSLFGVSALIYFWGIARERVLALLPTARTVVVDQLPEAVLVLDEQDRVVDANRAALRALGLTEKDAIGRPAVQLLHHWGIDLSRYPTSQPAHDELRSGHGATQKVLDVSIAPIQREDAPRGRIVVLRDVTERELAREAEASSAALDAQREAEERIRREIAALLHGRIQNQLLSLVFQMGELEREWKDAPPEALAQLRAIRDNLDRVRDREVRIASHRLYPALLDMGLAAALHMLGERYLSHFAISYFVEPAFSALDAPLDNKLPMPLRETAYRVVEEALSNAQRHSGASRVEVTLGLAGADGKCVLIRVRDNGRGADREAIKPRLGLRSVEARVRNLGGTWRFESTPGEGATLAVELPLVRPAALAALPAYTAEEVMP
ncbi:MAG TPA: histidine kinase N-terminal 7TM domain-containing protein, partial [Chloroflexota bacterium]|nr:histidine kinase N-terminal 7TM domain-containing protein [Chloroflexota bacterium]